jgi:pimeloyl-ACP methyl ester carboxylesterase
MKLEQRALRFHSAGIGLIGIVDVPERPLVRGMLLLPDSTQYRSGSQRQFTLLSRLLAARGVAVMRFDRRGAGDSEGKGDGAERGSAHAAEDIAAAMKEFFIHVPEMKESVILAPGDAAPLALDYAAGDARVTGLALLHPLLPEAALAGPQRAQPASAAGRLLRRAAAFRRAAARREADGQAGGRPGFDAFGGRVLLVAPASGPVEGATCALRAQGPRSRRIDIAGAGFEERGNAWREAVAFACASWLTSW